MASPRTRLAVLLFTDIVGSTDLKARLGTAVYAPLLDAHNRLFETGVAAIPGAEVIKHTGDGYFAAFNTASDAVRFAIGFQRAMAAHLWRPEALTTRVGIHVGEVQLVEQAGRSDVIGLTADLAARIMSLAQGGQILMTAQAFNDARQFLPSLPLPPGEGWGEGGTPDRSRAPLREVRREGEPAPASPGSGDQPPKLVWLAHGPYLFKGNDEPLDVFEVGLDGVSPLAAPPSSDKAKRVARHDEEQTLGWRPAAGLEVPGRAKWKLVKKLGEGGFGEVWLAQHEQMRQQRVFKFCFDAERLRSFKREMTLFRLIKESLGDRPDIARLWDVQLDEPPFFLESEYTPGGNLVDWAERRGGIGTVGPNQRVEIVACVADAVAAAHSVGILHKDVKPANVLMHEFPTSPSDDLPGTAAPGVLIDSETRVQPRLTDFGIGVLADRTRLGRHQITAAGFTQVTMDDLESRTGTRMYAPPESLQDKPFSTKGDVYALGVMLYQLVVGDLNRPIGEGWERQVDDPLMREDIAAAVDADPARRLDSAKEFASRLRALPRRRVERQSQEFAARVVAARRKRVRTAIAALSLLLVAALGGVIASGVYIKRVNAEKQRADEQRQRAEKLNGDLEGQIALVREKQAEADAQRKNAERAARETQAAIQFMTEMLGSADPSVTRGKELTVLDVLGKANLMVGGRYAGDPNVEAAVRDVLGRTYQNLGRYDMALPNLQLATKIRREKLGPQARETVESMNNLGTLLISLGRVNEAIPLLTEAVDNAKKLPDSAEFKTDTAVAQIMNNLAMALSSADRNEEAEPLFRQLLERAIRVEGAKSQRALLARNNLASVLMDQQKYAEAEALQREVLEALRSGVGDTHPLTITAMSNVGECLRLQRKLAASEQLAREALRLAREVQGPTHPDTIRTMSNLASVLSDEGRLDEAAPLFRGSYETSRAQLGDDHPITIIAGQNYADFLRHRNEYGEAGVIARRTAESSQKLHGPDSSSTLVSQLLLFEITLKQGNVLVAEPMAVSLEQAATRLGDKLPARVRLQLLATRGRILAAKGKYADAAPVLEQSLAQLRDAGVKAAGLIYVLEDLVTVNQKLDRARQAAECAVQLLEAKAAAGLVPTTQPATRSI
jgi:serine/threonine protein kinase/class 3 adenylate cyclase